LGRDQDQGRDGADDRHGRRDQIPTIGGGQLVGSAERSVLAGRAAADHDDVVIRAHESPRCFARMPSM
jgi:hypothetical protein